MSACVQSWRDELAEMGWTTSERAQSAGWQVVATRDNESLLAVGLDRHANWIGIVERARKLRVSRAAFTRTATANGSETDRQVSMEHVSSCS